MSGSLVGIELGVGAAILAIWVEARLGERRPGSVRTTMAHSAVAFVLVQATSIALGHLIGDGTPLSTKVVLLFVLFLPALVYAFVAGLWLLRTAGELVR